MEKSVRVIKNGVNRLRTGHPWAFRGELTHLQGNPGPGDIVRVLDERSRCLGFGFYTPLSLISLRMITRSEVPPDGDFWLGRIRSALSLRRQVIDSDTNTWRLIYAEADGIPGLVADWYHGVLVAQILTAGTEALWPLLQEHLVAELRPTGILARGDQKVRTLEGLEQGKQVLYGEVAPELQVMENGLPFIVDPWNGQKTGAYLDQRENRLAVRAYARGQVLDCFSYQGWFASNLARGGATRVTSVDGSAAAVEMVRRNVALGGFDQVEAIKANCFDLLTEYAGQGRHFDMVLLDPPAFAKSRDSIESGVRGYKDINLRAMKLLLSGGILVTSSCSYHLSESRFIELLEDAARDAGRSFQMLERRMQGRDHPLLLGHPESWYLKTFILRML